MPDVTIHWRIEGANRVRNELRHWAHEFPHVLDEQIGDFTTERAQRLRRKAYPPERVGQTYVRTGNLGAGWFADKIKAAVWEIVNLVEYAGWVVDQHYQAWMHRGRWWIFQDEIRPVPDFTQQLTAALERLIDG